MLFRVVFAVALVAVPAVWGYSAGAPPEVCGDLTPQHHVAAQSSASPYILQVSNSQIRSGQAVNVEITGRSAGDTIKGFFVVARDSANNAVGQFQVDPSDPIVQTRNCPGGNQVSCYVLLLRSYRLFSTIY